MRHLIRRFLKSPVFTGITLLTLAIGIGANTAVFSVVQGVLLKPLPYTKPEQLVFVAHTAPGLKLNEAPMAPANYFTYREQGKSFQDIGMWTWDSVSVTGVAEPEDVPGIDITETVLPVLGVQPIL